MDTLRLLEEVPPALEPPASPTITTATTATASTAAVTSMGRGRGSWGGSVAAVGVGRLSDGKLESILSYLDQVERTEVNRSNQLVKPPPASSLFQSPANIQQEK